MALTEERGAGHGAPGGDLRALLAGDDWKSKLPSALAKVGTEVGADRCYVFENMRGPDGRLWMDLIGEWTAQAVASVFVDTEQHLHPYFPDFQGWIDVLDDRRWSADVAPTMRTLAAVVTESVMRQEILAEQSMRQDLYRTIVEE